MLLTSYLISGQKCGVDITEWDTTDLGGNSAFLAEDSVGVGRVDISSIDNWALYGEQTQVDYKKMCDEIKALVDTAGYGTLASSEKQVALKCFVAGAGNDYLDPLFTTSQYDEFYKIHTDKINSSFREREFAVLRLLNKKVYTGVITQIEGSHIATNSREERTAYVEDHVIGTNYGNASDGIMDWLENTSAYSGVAITAIDTGAKKFSIGGNYKNKIADGQVISISGSTANDGIYTVDGQPVKSGANTEVTVVEAIPDATVDGTLYYNGFKMLSCYSDTLRDEAKDIYVNGVY